MNEQNEATEKIGGGALAVPDNAPDPVDNGDGLGDLREPLNPREIAFAEDYAANGNATRAALRAEYGNGNVDSAAVQGARLLRNVAVRAYIDGLLDAYGCSRGELIRNLSAVANSEWKEHVLIVGVNGTTGETYTRMDLRSLVQANEILMKVRGMLKDGQAVPVPVQVVLPPMFLAGDLPPAPPE